MHSRSRGCWRHGNAVEWQAGHWARGRVGGPCGPPQQGECQCEVCCHTSPGRGYHRVPSQHQVSKAEVDIALPSSLLPCPSSPSSPPSHPPFLPPTDSCQSVLGLKLWFSSSATVRPCAGCALHDASSPWQQTVGTCYMYLMPRLFSNQGKQQCIYKGTRSNIRDAHEQCCSCNAGLGIELRASLNVHA